LEILSVPARKINSRGWFYFIPATGTPEKILHAIESSNLDHLPGNAFIYSSQKELITCLARISGKKVAVQYSKDLAIISYLDYGMAENLKDAGITLVSSATLLQRLQSTLDEKMISSHETAANHLYEIVKIVWDRVRATFPSSSLTEGEVQRWILNEFEERGLETDHPPVTASGVHSADPHYAPVGEGALLEKEEVLQLDMWAKLPGGIFADISWVGYLGEKAPPEVEAVFAALVSARDGCVELINSRLSKKCSVEGKEVDTHARGIIESRGYGRFLMHRTGHSIDTRCHGSGVNLDAVEFPDSRFLLEGSCFSIEPGIYTPTFGLRTEIDVYISAGVPVVSGAKPQHRVLTLSDSPNS
jgi:Xaa-Pro dipeptidase